jgi:hypothetical protein
MPRGPASPVPDPPDFTHLQPRFTPWPRGKPLIRVFDSAHPPDAFHPGTRGGIRGRFHFFTDASGGVVPVMYGASSEDGAFSETVFRDVPVQGPVRVVRAKRLRGLSLVKLIPERELTLVELLGHGLKRLHVLPEHLTTTPATEYPRTVSWAQALHRTFSHIDGLIWMARQFNAAEACILFGDRVGSDDLRIAAPPLPLSLGPGRARLEVAANAAGIAVI